MRVWWVLVVALAAAGCGGSSPVACPAIAVAGGVSVEVRDYWHANPTATGATICVDSACATVLFARQGTSARIPTPGATTDRTVQVGVTLLDATGNVVAATVGSDTLRESHPYAPGCGGPVFSAGVAVARTGGVHPTG